MPVNSMNLARMVPLVMYTVQATIANARAISTATIALSPTQNRIRARHYRASTQAFACESAKRSSIVLAPNFTMANTVNLKVN